MQKIILYYKFVPIKDPEAVRLWQKNLCEKLNLKGRILISKKGINGTLGGELTSLKAYTKELDQYPALKGIDIKYGDGTQDDFPRLSVKIRSETVTLGLPDDIKVNKQGVVNGGKRIRPDQLDEFISKNPDTVLFDGRNNYESAIGKFKNAIAPNVDNFRDFPKEIKKSRYRKIKGRPVVTYCTGGIRCEVLSALLKKEGFDNVYQLDGGIVRYGQLKGDQGLWEGKCFVFDKRMSVGFSDSSTDIGECSLCSVQTSRYINCINKACNKLILVCDSCKDNQACSQTCLKTATVVQ